MKTNFLKISVTLAFLLVVMAGFDAYSNYADNRISGAVVQATLPNLVATDMKFYVERGEEATNIMQGTGFVVSAFVENKADTAVSGAFRNMWFVNGKEVERPSPGEIIDISNISISNRVDVAGGSAYSLLPRNSINTEIVWLVRTPGTYTFRAEFDYLNQISETNENDNVVERTIVVLPQSSTGQLVSSSIVTAGWNILSANALYRMSSTTCDKGKIGKTVYEYDPDTNGYLSYSLDANLKSTGLGAGLAARGSGQVEARAVWLYNFGTTCTLSYYGASLKGYTIVAPKGLNGWNMAAVQPEWLDRPFYEILGSSCDQIKFGDKKFVGFFYNITYSGGWSRPLFDDDIVPADAAGKGLWLNTRSDGCVLRLN